VTTLRISGVAASYGGQPVLHGLDLVVPSGTTSAILGPSGCGKTTLLRVVAGFQVPDAGTVQLDDETVVGPGAWVAPERRGIGYVAQEGNLFPHLSVAANIAYGLPRGERRRERRAGQRVHSLLELVGLRVDLVDRRPDQLSGGQQQRVALARAVARKPALLLLDEPLSALDAELRSRMQDDLLRLHRRIGFTALLVSHDIGEVFKLAQRVLRVETGSIVQAGTPAELFLRQRLAGKLQLHAQVLAVRREEVVHVVSLLIGQDIVDVLASDDEVAGLREGDLVSVAAKAISPMIFKK
jgi:ABC-type Fe3+/spermidine/putrescine transport system ATPase subunit